MMTGFISVYVERVKCFVEQIWNNQITYWLKIICKLGNICFVLVSNFHGSLKVHKMHVIGVHDNEITVK